MIQVNVSEVKNRLSYYLRLVRGGEQIEILDRNTPLARIIHVSQADADDNKTPWMKEVERLGLVTPPQKKGYSQELLAREKVILAQKKRGGGVLKALLEERKTMKGRLPPPNWLQ
jgi:prevent-host-death family protein